MSVQFLVGGKIEVGLAKNNGSAARPVMRIGFLSLGRCLVLGGILVVLGLLLILPATQRIYWVGVTDLEIEYIVTDVVTEKPIEGATIKVRSEGGYAEREKQEFSLMADTDGSAKRLCKDCMCHGTSGWDIDTYFVHPPGWFYQVTAEGYSPTEWTELGVPENVHRVQRAKPAAKLVVQIKLEKKAAEAVAEPNRGGR